MGLGSHAQQTSKILAGIKEVFIQRISRTCAGWRRCKYRFGGALAFVKLGLRLDILKRDGTVMTETCLKKIARV